VKDRFYQISAENPPLSKKLKSGTLGLLGTAKTPTMRRQVWGEALVYELHTLMVRMAVSGQM